MEILKYKKDKGNTYKVYFKDGECVLLYDDVIIKYNLLIDKDIDNKLFNEIIDYNDFLDGYYKSIKYINKRMRTELEIKKYLNKFDIKSSDINKIVSMLYNDGYLNNTSYIKAYISDKYNLSNEGVLKIKKDLIDLGFQEEELNDTIDSFDWNNKMINIINKKIKINYKLSVNLLKNKIINDLSKLGFQKQYIVDYLDSYSFKSDDDILLHEFNKIFNKYSSKYSGNELEYKVINYLYKKGFNMYDIKRCYDENKV